MTIAAGCVVPRSAGKFTGGGIGLEKPKTRRGPANQLPVEYQTSCRLNAALGINAVDRSRPHKLATNVECTKQKLRPRPQLSGDKMARLECMCLGRTEVGDKCCPSVHAVVCLAVLRNAFVGQPRGMGEGARGERASTRQWVHGCDYRGADSGPTADSAYLRIHGICASTYVG